MGFRLFWGQDTSPGSQALFPSPRAMLGAICGLLPGSLCPYIRGPDISTVLCGTFSAEWPGLLYNIYWPMNDSSGIDVVPIRDCPQEEINGQNQLLNYLGMKYPIELVSASM